LDVHDGKTRSRNMAAIRSKNTKPELVVRRLASALGGRYRLNHKTPFGRPDLVFVRKRKAIFVHGCYWHRHSGCRYMTFPASNVDFWQKKFDDNVKRDRLTLARFKSGGWKALVVWECETRNEAKLSRKLARFLDV
jgi:DNA mismatch endonuclease (patch repair protein)